ncbi:MAG: flavodoxin domain-containing protein [Promethearchaeota archaeon]
MTKVLIAYESIHGYTTQVVNFIKDRLVELGLDVLTCDVIRNKNQEVYPLEQYKGIIVGTCVGVSAFKKLKKTFFKKDLVQYKDDSHFVAVFTNSPDHIVALVKPSDNYYRYISKKLGFTPDMCEVFKPVLDFTAFSPLSSDDKKIFRFISRTKLRKGGIEVDLNGVNDFRDWDNIAAFADRFASLLQ